MKLAMDFKYRSKENCKNEAARLIDQHLVTGMTQKQIQEEIFAHAVAYYDGTTLLAMAGALGPINGIASAVLISHLVSHADPIDIENNGDTAERQVLYTLIWDKWPSIF